MIQELELTHRHHMARPSPGIPLQIKICLHSFVFFCDDIGSLTFNRGRNTTSDEVQTQTQWQPRKNIGCTRVCCDSVLCCIFHSFAPPPDVWCVLCMWGPSVQHRPGGPWCQGRLRPVLVTGPGSVLAQTRERRHRQWQGESGQSREETRRLERILSTVTMTMTAKNYQANTIYFKNV